MVGRVDEESSAETLDGTSADPPVVLSHIAYFFVPLPDPLGLPDKFVVRVAEDAPAEWYHTGEGPPPPPVHLAGSLMFHKAERPSLDADGLSVLFDVAAKALLAPEGSDPKVGVERPTADMTVVEMAIGFDMPPDTAEGSESGDGPDEPFWLAVSDAFDRGLERVRDVQRSYYMVRRQPIRLVAREAMPFAVPCGIRQVFDDRGEPLEFRAPMSMFLLHMNVSFRDEDLADEEQDVLFTAMHHQSANGLFASYLDFVREAEVAISRDGAYRAAVLFTATACEVLLDDLLAHMLWQERVRPEDAAAVFQPWLTTRVKTQYHARLGGIWSLERPGPVRDWFVDVAGLRNRVVHSGYDPSLDEARTSVEAAHALNAYLCDLLSEKTGPYPRTAVVLPGVGGLRRRGKWTRRLADLADDPAEVPWTVTFARWRQALQREREDSPVAVRPTVADAWIYLVVRPGGHRQWILHDRTAGLAAVVDPGQVTGVLPGQQVKIDEMVDEVSADLTDALSISVAGAEVSDPLRLAWVPEYRLVPLAGVMVDGKDLEPV